MALKLKSWIHDVLQRVDPWMSATDIGAGARWGPQIAAALEETRFGVVCLTKQNATATWLLFETGALAKTVKDTFVCPYLIEMEPADIPEGPLRQFQAKQANREGTFELLSAINKTMIDGALTDEQLARAFDKWWDDLNATLTNLPVPDTPARRHREEIQEISENLYQSLLARGYVREANGA